MTNFWARRAGSHCSADEEVQSLHLFVSHHSFVLASASSFVLALKLNSCMRLQISMKLKRGCSFECVID